jgi:hypothetical protein
LLGIDRVAKESAEATMVVMLRDFSTVSPSAKSLLLVKAQTPLPYATRAASLLFGPDAVAAAAPSAPATRARVAHFELRARSLSFRGLALAARSPVTYVDTDLPEMASLKADLVAQLHPPSLPPLVGTLHVQPLNALDADAFRETVHSLPSGGEIAILHEGLLMYLDDDEKARLAASVREALLARGGAWITADVYVRSETHLPRDAKTEKFLTAHRVEENKFADWEAAEAFFTSNGFEIARKLAPSED